MTKAHYCHETNFVIKPKWGDPEKWKRGHWYPLPMRNDENNDFPEGWCIGWALFKIDPSPLVKEDVYAITPVDLRISSFYRAVELCEAHNGESLPR